MLSDPGPSAAPRPGGDRRPGGGSRPHATAPGALSVGDPRRDGRAAAPRPHRVGGVTGARPAAPVTPRADVDTKADLSTQRVLFPDLKGQPTASTCSDCKAKGRQQRGL